jgi:hypothetical protein
MKLKYITAIINIIIHEEGQNPNPETKTPNLNSFDIVICLVS